MLRAFYWTSDSGGKEISGVNDFKEMMLVKDSFLWVDLTAPADKESFVLTHDYGFHPLAIEDVLSEEVGRPKVDDYENYLFVVFHFIGRPGGEDEVPVHDVGLFLTGNSVVTVHSQPLDIVDALFARFIRDDRIVARGADFVFHAILDNLVDSYNKPLAVLEAETDRIEDDVFEEPKAEIVKRIFNIRRDTLHMRRIIAPLREVVHQMTVGTFPLISDRVTIYFSDISDHLSRMMDEADGYRDVLNSALEAYFSSVSERTNQIIKVLTIFTAILLPPTFIVGLYGMNFEHIPELSWRYGYVFVWIIIVLVVVGLLVLFKKRKWI